MKEGKFTYLVGDNGTGKSRALARLAKEMEHVPSAMVVACIANSVYDRFTYSSNRTGKIRYLGARNAANAVFHSAIERQLARLILDSLLVNRRLLTRLSKAVKMSFSFSPQKIEIESIDSSDIRSETRRKRARATLLAPRPLAMLKRITRSKGKFEDLTDSQIGVLSQYLGFGLDFEVIVHLPDGREIPFGALSTGELNRTMVLAKVMCVAEEGAVFLIDEPELSLHLHWQMEFHKTLVEFLAHLKYFHVVVATHAPIIVSEAAKNDAGSTVNSVAVLRRILAKGEQVGDHAPGEAPVTVDFHSFSEVASHDQLVLRYFQTSPYHSLEISQEIADTVLNFAARSSTKRQALDTLNELRSAAGLSKEAEKHLEIAIDIVERELLRSIRREA